ncbi:hypothetical protein ACS0TY_002404 [Phlomoides rotata]
MGGIATGKRRRGRWSRVMGAVMGRCVVERAMKEGMRGVSGGTGRARWWLARWSRFRGKDR